MDKYNYTIEKAKIQELKENFERIYEDIEKEFSKTNVIKRKRIIKDYRTLITAVFLYITDELSFQRLSDVMASKYNVVMSDTAWRKQILKIADRFIEISYSCLQKILQQSQKENKHIFLNHSKYYAIDATNLSTSGKEKTFVRLHVEYDLDTACADYISITDNHVGETLNHFKVKNNALYLADRAYGKSKQMEHIVNENADFILRISPHQIKLFKGSDCKERINLSEYLSENEFSLICYVKHKKHVFPIKVIGIKKPIEKQIISEKKVKRKAQKNQNKLSQETIDFSKWFIVATSIIDDTSSAEITDLYKLRWQIELFFKRMKTHLRLRKIKHSSSLYANCIVKLWLSLGFIICSTKFALLNDLNFNISEFNLFSLIKYFFA